jgi:rare lipoprotein A
VITRKGTKMTFTLGRVATLALSGLLAACGSDPIRDAHEPQTIVNAVPRAEPLCRRGNPESYDVFGKRYFPMKTGAGFQEVGVASWYGPGFHGRRTSCGEFYDMYQMTAAHKRLPIPAYCEVTNLENGRKVVVRVNDRGPFHEDRIIDLSYAAALKLGIANRGTGRVHVRVLDPSVPMTTHTPLLADRAAAAPSLPPPSKVSILGATERAPTPSALQQTAAAPSDVAMAIVRPFAAKTPPALDKPIESSLADKTPAAVYVQVGAFADKVNAERLKEKIGDEVRAAVHIQQAHTAERPFYRVQIGPLANAEVADRIAQTLMRLGLDNHRVIAN